MTKYLNKASKWKDQCGPLLCMSLSQVAGHQTSDFFNNKVSLFCEIYLWEKLVVKAKLGQERLKLSFSGLWAP